MHVAICIHSVGDVAGYGPVSFEMARIFVCAKREMHLGREFFLLFAVRDILLVLNLSLALL